MLEGLIGALLGALATGVVSILIEYHKNTNRIISLAQIFIADMNTISRLIEYRKYIDLLEESASKKELLTIKINQNFLEIFEKNSTEIGILPYDFVDSIIKYYTYSKAAIEDVNYFCNDNSRADSYTSYNELAVILITMQNLEKEYYVKASEHIKLIKSKYIYKFTQKIFG